MAIMATKASLLVVAMAAAVLGTALGASYTVGAPSGSWDLRTNYNQWASGINFRMGDQLVFKYSRAAHNVVEVSKADYDSCSGSSPISTLQTGDDTIPLTTTGTRYFICGVPGHCDNGMKIAVKIEAGGSGTNTAPPAMAPRPRVPTAMAPGSAMPPASVVGQAVPPSSSAIKSAAGVVESLVGLGLGVLAAGLMLFY